MLRQVSRSLVAVVATAAILAVVRPASAQFEQNFNLDINASVGMEGIEEPDGTSDGSGEANLKTNAYVNVDAGVLVQAHILQSFIAAPLRFRTDGFKLREQDWDTRPEVLRVFRCVRLDYMRWGGSLERLDEDGSCQSWTPDEAVGSVSSARERFTYLSARLTPVNNYAVGYGTIIDGYTADIEENDYVAGVGMDVNVNRFWVMSAILGDVSDPDVVGGRTAFRPMQRTNYEDGYDGFASDTARQLFMEVGGTAVTDLTAPVTRTDDMGVLVNATDNVTVVGGDIRIRTDRESTEYMHDYKVTRFELGAEWNHIVGYDGGAHGHLRLYHDIGWLDFYVDGQYRYVGSQYIPRYFDQHYRVQRSQYLLSEAQREGTSAAGRLGTKLDALRALPRGGEHGYGSSARFRFWIPKATGDGWRKLAELRLFVEGVPGRAASNSAGVEASIINIENKLDIYGRFAQQGWDSPADLFRLKNSILSATVVYDLTDQLYLQADYSQTWFQVSAIDFDSTNNFGLQLGVNY